MEKLSPFNKEKDLSKIAENGEAFDELLDAQISPKNHSKEAIMAVLNIQPLKRAIVNLKPELLKKFTEALPGAFQAVNALEFSKPEYAAQEYADTIRLVYKNVIQEYTGETLDALKESEDARFEVALRDLLNAPWEKDEKTMPNPSFYLDWVGSLYTQFEDARTIENPDNFNWQTYDEFTGEQGYTDPYVKIDDYVQGTGGDLGRLAQSVGTGIVEVGAGVIDTVQANIDGTLSSTLISTKLNTYANKDIAKDLTGGLEDVEELFDSFLPGTIHLFLPLLDEKFDVLKKQTPPATSLDYAIAIKTALLESMRAKIEEERKALKRGDPKFRKWGVILIALKDENLPAGMLPTPENFRTWRKYVFDSTKAPLGYVEYAKEQTLDLDGENFADPFSNVAPEAPTPPAVAPADAPATAEAGTDADATPGVDTPPPAQETTSALTKEAVTAHIATQVDGVAPLKDLKIEEIDDQVFITYAFRGAKEHIEKFPTLDSITIWKNEVDSKAYKDGKVEFGKEMAHAIELAGAGGAIGAVLGVLWKMLTEGGFLSSFFSKDKKEAKEKKGYEKLDDLLKARFGLDIEGNEAHKQFWESVKSIPMAELDLFVKGDPKNKVPAENKTRLEKFKTHLDGNWVKFKNEVLNTDIDGKGTGSDQLASEKIKSKVTIFNYIKGRRKQWPNE